MPLRSIRKNNLVNWVIKDNSGLPFSQIQCKKLNNINKLFNEGINKKLIVPYPPLIDKSGTFTSQCEHTIHVKDKGVEILSLGDDY